MGNIPVSGGGGGAAVWGSITGTLSNQTDLNSALALKAPLASPALTGSPTAPTKSAFDNSTHLATTAYVDGQVLGIQEQPFLVFEGIPYVPLLSVTAPPTTGWTWVNQGASTVTSTGQATPALDFDFQPNLGNDQVRAYMRSIPGSSGAPYTVSIGMLSIAHAIGMVISDGTKYIFVWQNGQGTLLAYTFNTATSVNTNYFSDFKLLGQSALGFYLRFTSDGTTRRVLVGDGRNWNEINEQPAGTFLTETQFGIALETNQTFHGKATLIHVDSSNP